MNTLIRKGLRDWKKILRNPWFYYEILKEEIKSFKYPPGVTSRYAFNIFKLRHVTKLLRSCNKLHIGCGTVKLEGFVNIDVFKTPAADFICNIKDLPKYIRRDSIALIYSSHTLEHFSNKDSVQVLRMFYDLLEPGGELRISVPDLLRLTEVAKTKHLVFTNMELIQGVLMGGQETKFNYHKSIYWFAFLTQILSNVGFKNIEEYPSYPHFLGDVKDASSLAEYTRLGQYISLNVKATK